MDGAGRRWKDRLRWSRGQRHGTAKEAGASRTPLRRSEGLGWLGSRGRYRNAQSAQSYVCPKYRWGPRSVGGPRRSTCPHPTSPWLSLSSRVGEKGKGRERPYDAGWGGGHPPRRRGMMSRVDACWATTRQSCQQPCWRGGGANLSVLYYATSGDREYLSSSESRIEVMNSLRTRGCHPTRRAGRRQGCDDHLRRNRHPRCRLPELGDRSRVSQTRSQGVRRPCPTAVSVPYTLLELF